jgi:hypothetical protein
MPVLKRNDKPGTVFIEPAACTENQAKPFGLSVAKTENEFLKVPLNETERHEQTPFHVDDPLNNYGGQKLP